MTENGCCYLVGGGPGDPGLLTRRALAVLRLADAVYYDALIDPLLLKEVPETARQVYVGKRAQVHAVPQDRICAQLIQETRAGKIVVRLKGGDPFVFGRGGEEALALAEAGCRFEVIPGVSSGIAACTYAGIPVTHRALSTGITFVTGHETPDKPETQVDWATLAKLDHTLCIFMGVGRLEGITKELVAHGMPADRPAAVIQQGATTSQSVVTATLSTLHAAVEEAKLQPPAMIVIGPVVELRSKLNWFEQRPLFGKTVLITRARSQASALRKLLEEVGARVLEAPAIRIETTALRGASGLGEMVRHHGAIAEAEMARCDPLSHALIDMITNTPDWVVFTSANGVEQALKRLFALGWDARAFAGARIAVIGTGTAEALRAFGLRADLIPERFVGESLADALKEVCGNRIRSTYILLLRADNARSELADRLKQAGAKINDVVTYHVESADCISDEILEALRAGAVDWITFASGGTVTSFIELLGESRALLTSDTRPRLASIGPITSDSMRAAGLSIDTEAQTHTLQGMVDAILQAEDVGA